MRKYYNLTQSGKEADIYIFGDITSWEWAESDVSSYTLARELFGLDVNVINVHINSYGGEVGEGLAIHSILKNHPAKVKTYCDGFACSIASVIFMAGDERIMNNSSLLMIHNAWTCTAGNANELRKTADDLDVITQGSANVYMQNINISEEELKALLDAETWLLPEQALEMGFATSVIGAEQTNKVAASAHKALFSLLKTALQEAKQLEDAEPDPNEPEPPKEPQEPTEETPKENTTLKFFNALIGRKD